MLNLISKANHHIPYENFNELYFIDEYTNTVNLDEFISKCVDIDKFLKYCNECPNYGNTWSCPPYDFDPMVIWNKYTSITLIGRKITITSIGKETIAQKTGEEAEDLISSIIFRVTNDMRDMLLKAENEAEGRLALSMGSCTICEPAKCTRHEQKPCKYLDKMRYSVESLGGNVELALKEYLGMEIKWLKANEIPEYFIFMGGILA